MNYTIAVFKSRFATLNFANLLRSNNIPSAIINTPQSIGRACGISVKFLSDYYSKVQSLMNRINIASFAGFYSFSEHNGQIRIFKT